MANISLQIPKVHRRAKGKLKKIASSFIILAVCSGIVFAGTIIQVTCSKCGFKSSPLTEGCGFAGVGHTIVFCNTCKDFYSIPTKIVFETDIGKGAELVKPIGKQRFLGLKCLVYPCPKCGSVAYSYKGSLCPLCHKGRLRREKLGFWD